MIIITKKLHPRRLAAGCLLGACAVILLGAAFGVVEAVPAAPVSSVAAADGSDIRTNADRVAYLESLGWLTAAQPSAEEALTLPTKFDEAYQAYLTPPAQPGLRLGQIRRGDHQALHLPGQKLPRPARKHLGLSLGLQAPDHRRRDLLQPRRRLHPEPGVPDESQPMTHKNRPVGRFLHNMIPVDVL